MVCHQERSLPDGAPSTSQKGIMEFLKPEGSYTQPIPQSPIPCARVLLIQEIEQLDVFRQSILSQTGEILCVDGTRQVIFIFLFITIIIYQTRWGLQPSTFNSEYSSSNYESAG